MKVYELINELQCFPGGEEVFCLEGAEGPVLTVAGEPAIDLPSAGVDIQAAADEAAEAAEVEAGVEASEEADGTLADIQFASEAAAEKADFLGLEGEDFDAAEASGAGGFTVADVDEIFEALEALAEEGMGESADSGAVQGEEAG